MTVNNEKAYYVGHRNRLRKRFLSHASSIFDYELIELLLFYVHSRCDTKPLAKDLLSHFKSIKNLVLADTSDIKKVKGIGSSAIILVKLVCEIFNRMHSEAITSSTTITSSEHVVEYYKNTLSHLKKEQLCVMFLNNKNKLLANEVVHTGTVNTIAVYPREIIHSALIHGASAFIMVHNHPSGDPKPSRQDIIMTKMIKEVAEKLGIVMLDHLIIGKNCSYSMKEVHLI
jgi:DNA repair protein RadC